MNGYVHNIKKIKRERLLKYVYTNLGLKAEVIPFIPEQGGSPHSYTMSEISFEGFSLYSKCELPSDRQMFKQL